MSKFQLCVTPLEDRSCPAILGSMYQMNIGVIAPPPPPVVPGTVTTPVPPPGGTAMGIVAPAGSYA